MKIRWQHCLTGLLALLGFSSCNPEEIFGGWGMTAYGQPHANYKVTGEVKDPAGKPVEGIRVVVSPGGNHPEYYNDTLYTDAKGQFQKEQLKYTWPDVFKEGTIRFDDVDGDKNGSYMTKVLRSGEFDVKQTKKSKDTWYKGDFTISAKTMMNKAE